jgi:Flp pilus assembly protein CpaB
MLSRTRTFALMAVVSGLVAGLFMLLVLVQNNRARAREIEEARRKLGQQVTVLVTRRNIDANHILTEDDIAPRQFFQTDLPQGVSLAQDAEDVVGRITNIPLFAGEPIYLDKLGAGLKPVSALVPPGHVAFAMPISPDFAAGALINPGDVIDIIQVAGGTSFGTTPEATTILFKQVEVLGIAGQYPYGGVMPTGKPATEEGSAGFGATSARTTQGEDAVRDKILLLNLTPEQAVVLADAMEHSRLYVALHSRRQ